MRKASAGLKGRTRRKAGPSTSTTSASTAYDHYASTYSYSADSGPNTYAQPQRGGGGGEDGPSTASGGGGGGRVGAAPTSGRRRDTPTGSASADEAALTAKNYRLAKELSDLRVRHRDETKAVTRLTMENMNLAARVREAMGHVAMLKREVNIYHQKNEELTTQLRLHVGDGTTTTATSATSTALALVATSTSASSTTASLSSVTATAATATATTTVETKTEERSLVLFEREEEAQRRQRQRQGQKQQRPDDDGVEAETATEVGMSRGGRHHLPHPQDQRPSEAIGDEDARRSANDTGGRGEEEPSNQRQRRQQKSQQKQQEEEPLFPHQPFESPPRGPQPRRPQHLDAAAAFDASFPAITADDVLDVPPSDGKGGRATSGGVIDGASSSADTFNSSEAFSDPFYVDDSTRTSTSTGGNRGDASNDERRKNEDDFFSHSTMIESFERMVTPSSSMTPKDADDGGNGDHHRFRTPPSTSFFDNPSSDFDHGGASSVTDLFRTTAGGGGGGGGGGGSSSNGVGSRSRSPDRPTKRMGTETARARYIAATTASGSDASRDRGAGDAGEHASNGHRQQQKKQQKKKKKSPPARLMIDENGFVGGVAVGGDEEESSAWSPPEGEGGTSTTPEVEAPFSDLSPTLALRKLQQQNSADMLSKATEEDPLSFARVVGVEEGWDDFQRREESPPSSNGEDKPSLTSIGEDDGKDDDTLGDGVGGNGAVGGGVAVDGFPSSGVQRGPSPTYSSNGSSSVGSVENKRPTTSSQPSSSNSPNDRQSDGSSPTEKAGGGGRDRGGRSRGSEGRSPRSRQTSTRLSPESMDEEIRILDAIATSPRTRSSSPSSSSPTGKVGNERRQPDPTAAAVDGPSSQHSRRRNVRKPISYAEPSLSAKLRRGDVFFPVEMTTKSPRGGGGQELSSSTSSSPTSSSSTDPTPSRRQQRTGTGRRPSSKSSSTASMNNRRRSDHISDSKNRPLVLEATNHSQANL